MEAGNGLDVPDSALRHAPLRIASHRTAPLRFAARRSATLNNATSPKKEKAPQQRGAASKRKSQTPTQAIAE